MNLEMTLGGSLLEVTIMFYRDERLAVFIDGKSLYETTRALGYEVDYKLLRQEFARRGQLSQCNYYTVLLEDQDGEQVYDPLRPLVDWLTYNGYTTHVETMRQYTGDDGRVRQRGNLDIKITVDALTLAHTKRLDHAVLFTGNGDYTHLVEALKELCVRVSVASTILTQPPMMSDRLRRTADNFIDLGDEALKKTIRRPARVLTEKN